MVGSFSLKNEISFLTALSRLDAFKRQSFDDISQTIQKFTYVLKMHRALKETGLIKDERLAGLDMVADWDDFFTSLLVVIEDHFPIYDEAMYSDAMEEGTFYLLPRAMGMNSYYGDDFYEAIEHPEDTFDQDQSLVVFMRYLDAGITGEEWHLADDYFGWQVPIPPDPDANYFLNIEKLEEMLEKNGIQFFRDALEIAVGVSNIFFEINPYEMDDSVEFTTENFRNLEEEWKRAEEIINHADQALEMANNEPGLYQKFIYHWLASLEIREPERVRVRV